MYQNVYPILVRTQAAAMKALMVILAPAPWTTLEPTARYSLILVQTLHAKTMANAQGPAVQPTVALVHLTSQAPTVKAT